MTRPSPLALATLALLVVCPFLPGTRGGEALRVPDRLWIIRPDPPQVDQDLTIDYLGDDESVTYEIDGEDPVKVDVRSSGRIKLTKTALRGKRYVKLFASGGEEGFRIVRLPKPN